MSRLTLLALATAAATIACAPPATGRAPEAPIPGVTVPEAPAPAPPPPVAAPAEDGLVAIPDAIDCNYRIDFQRCPEGGEACRANQVKVNHHLGRWRLACEPLQPADPIAGERVVAIAAGKPEALPLAPNPQVCSDPERNHSPSITRRKEGALTVFEVASDRLALCRGGADTFAVSLGLLEAGEYEVRSPHSRQRFTVRPHGSDPGSFDEAMTLRLRIAQAHRIGQCFGMPPCDEPHRELVGEFEASRSSRRMERLFPQLPAGERRRIFFSAGAVTLEPTGPGAWSYGFVSGDTCSATTFRGQVTRAADGSLTISDPAKVASKLIPC